MILTVNCFAQTDASFKRTEVAEGISVSLPASFAPMPEALLNQKYYSSRKPLAAYTAGQQQLDFVVNTSNARWQAEDLPILQSFYRSNIMALYDEVQFIREDLSEINGKHFAVFEFASLVRPESDALTAQSPIRQYTYIQYTVHQGSTYVFTFSCPAEQQSQWQAIAQTMMNSVKIR